MISRPFTLFFNSKSLFSVKSISQRLLLIKGCDAIQPGLNCFISMIISVA